MAGKRWLKWFAWPLVPLIAILAAWVFLDTVQLNGVGASMASSAVVEGRRSSNCFGYQLRKGAAARFWNVTTPQGCANEVLAFANGNAMALRIDPPWTDSWGDTIPITMEPQPTVIINAFIMTADWRTESISVRIDKAKDDITRAVQIYGDSQCGITFAAGLIKDVHTNNFSSNLAFGGCSGSVAALNGVDGATSQRGIKVFYNDGPSGLAGETCADGNTAVIVMTQSATNETLAHELGHAFSLGDSNGAAGIDSTNLMLSPAPDPAALTLGQCFRTNINTTSVLNLDAYRSGTMRTCPDYADSPTCLKLGFPK